MAKNKAEALQEHDESGVAAEHKIEALQGPDEPCRAMKQRLRHPIIVAAFSLAFAAAVSWVQQVNSRLAKQEVASAIQGAMIENIAEDTKEIKEILKERTK